MGSNFLSSITPLLLLLLVPAVSGFSPVVPSSTTARSQHIAKTALHGQSIFRNVEDWLNEMFAKSIGQKTESLKASNSEAQKLLQEADEALLLADTALGMMDDLEDDLTNGINGVEEQKQDWSLLTVPNLKAELKSRGLPVSGRKVDLIARLEADDGDVADVSIPYDAASRLAYESSDKSVGYAAFKAKYEADAVAYVKSKQPGDVSIPYDAAAKLAYATSDKKMPYADFKAKYEADAVALVKSKQPNGGGVNGSAANGSSTNGISEKVNGSTPASETDWAFLTVPKLKAELKKLGLPVSGKKADLISRLKAQHGSSESAVEAPKPMKAPRSAKPAEPEGPAPYLRRHRIKAESAAKASQPLKTRGSANPVDTAAPFFAKTMAAMAEKTKVESSAKKKKSTQNFSQMTVPQLKAQLREKGLPVSGRKQELVERLQAS